MVPATARVVWASDNASAVECLDGVKRPHFSAVGGGLWVSTAELLGLRLSTSAPLLTDVHLLGIRLTLVPTAATTARAEPTSRPDAFAL